MGPVVQVVGRLPQEGEPETPFPKARPAAPSASEFGVQGHLLNAGWEDSLDPCSSKFSELPVLFSIGTAGTFLFTGRALHSLCGTRADQSLFF